MDSRVFKKYSRALPGRRTLQLGQLKNRKTRDSARGMPKRRPIPASSPIVDADAVADQSERTAAAIAGSGEVSIRQNCGKIWRGPVERG